MEDIIIILILLCITGSIIFYLYRAKKNSGTCIGCPYSKQCKKNYSSCNGKKTKNKK